MFEDQRIEALRGLHDLRQLSRNYIAKQRSFAEFYDGMGSILGTDFDPPESQYMYLSEAKILELKLYNDWTGGHWGETDHQIPKRKNWVYGIDTEPFGWIDQETYYLEYSKAFEALAIEDLAID